MENQQNEMPEMDLSPEELMQKKEEMKSFFEESIPYLKAQFEYEELLTKIDEARFKRVTIQYQYAMMSQGNPSGQEQTETEPRYNMEDETAHKRTLKKQ
jgi:hypothetical protein